ncbi:nuclear transport factor 2 family protein [Nostoc sp.]
MTMNQRSQAEVVAQVTDRNAKLDIARRFQTAIAARDWSAMRALLADDAHWTLPSDNMISGTANGADAVVDRARKITSYGLNFELQHILVGRDNVALSLHNTARQGDRVLDEYLATVCQFKDNRIAALETFLSDIDGMNAFFI